MSSLAMVPSLVVVFVLVWKRQRPTKPLSYCLCLILVALVGLPVTCRAFPDVRHSVIDGQNALMRYNASNKTFFLIGNLSNPLSNRFLSLHAHETFDGRGFSIDLTGTEQTGLFTINETMVQSMEQSPLIWNLHVIGGNLEVGGGFILKGHQKFARIESCSSTGNIPPLGGGIVGRGCDEIHISKSFSTGFIDTQAGGIVGAKSMNVDVTDCFSTGPIGGTRSGGIVGAGAKELLSISRSYSHGDVLQEGSGGLVGASTDESSDIRVSECFSTGDIVGTAIGGGGIVGMDTLGSVSISDSYTTGNIEAINAGGIMGGESGMATVSIRNTYASGRIDSNGTSGGIVGSVKPEATVFEIEYSVYNSSMGAVDIAAEGSEHISLDKGNSGSLGDIMGKLYCVNGSCWSEDIWITSGTFHPPILRFQLPYMPPAATVSPTPSRSPGFTSSPSSESKARPSVIRTVQFPHRTIKIGNMDQKKERFNPI
eukprot:gb/GECG01001120.1/.p1 GENE.gb/GECG01001120.1/~~gb/GECG01001120.1/.p1  ORF type:complete len:483 (+),score=43.67 gb/GECG01001120.1/:1-1449(+)